MRIARTSGWRPVATGLLAALLSIGAAAGPPSDGILETKVTRKGRVLQVRAALAAQAPATLCYSVLADFDHLEQFVPGLVSSEVISAPGEPIVLHQVGKASAGPFDYTLDVTLAVREAPPRTIEFDRVAGNLRQMKGSWTVAGDVAHCNVTYLADIETAFWVPPLVGPVLMRKRVQMQFEGVLQEIQRRLPPRDSP